MTSVKCSKNYRSLNWLVWQGRKRNGKTPAWGGAAALLRLEQVPEPVLPGIKRDSVE